MSPWLWSLLHRPVHLHAHTRDAYRETCGRPVCSAGRPRTMQAVWSPQPPPRLPVAPAGTNDVRRQQGTRNAVAASDGKRHEALRLQAPRVPRWLVDCISAQLADSRLRSSLLSHSPRHEAPYRQRPTWAGWSGHSTEMTTDEARRYGPHRRERCRSSNAQ